MIELLNDFRTVTQKMQKRNNGKIKMKK